jgi:hypothetical protein
MSDQRVRSGILARRRSRVIGFIITETSALGVLFLAGAFTLSPARLNGSALTISLNIVTIAAAAAVAIIPIIFFAIAPILPRGER